MRILAKLMTQNPEASRGIAEPPSGLGRRHPLDEIGPQRLVLSVGGVGRLQENAGEIRCFISWIYRHISTILHIPAAVNPESRNNPKKVKNSKKLENLGRIPAGAYWMGNPQASWLVYYQSSALLTDVRIEGRPATGGKNIHVSESGSMGIQASVVIHI